MSTRTRWILGICLGALLCAGAVYVWRRTDALTIAAWGLGGYGVLWVWSLWSGEWSGSSSTTSDDDGYLPTVYLNEHGEVNENGEVNTPWE